MSARFRNLLARNVAVTLSSVVLSVPALATNMVNNAGFENHMENWQSVGNTSMSNVAFDGWYSGKVVSAPGRLQQVISVQKNTDYRISARVKGYGAVGAFVGAQKFSANGGGSNWELVSKEFNSGNEETITIFGSFKSDQVRFDSFVLEPVNMGSCISPTNLSVISVTDDNTNDGHLPVATIDNNLTDSSRWSSSGNGKSITYDLGALAQLTAVDIAWYRGDTRISYFDIEASSDNNSWMPLIAGGESSGTSDNFEKFSIGGTSARYVRIVSYGNSVDDWNSILETKFTGCSQSQPKASAAAVAVLDPSKPPSGNFDLLDWTLSIPVDNDGDGDADIITEQQLTAGYKHSKYFYTGKDGGMVFTAPVSGPKTSANTKYTRSELREMLRRGNTTIGTKGVNDNNWVFSSAPSTDKLNAGGVDGELRATLAVNHVISTGLSSEVGRVVIGQIHANDDEPLRIYYRKLPGNSKGSIYLAHEPLDRSDQFFNVIGSKSSTLSNPVDGIALNEKFGFIVKVSGNTLKVTITRPGKPDASRTINMSDSDYDEGNQYMYFKVGAYNQNYTGDATDYSQVTFYEVVNSHAGYSH